eukprot:13212852-Alexandrium_andersonii.AAC.1
MGASGLGALCAALVRETPSETRCTTWLRQGFLALSDRVWVNVALRPRSRGTPSPRCSLRR